MGVKWKRKQNDCRNLLLFCDKNRVGKQRTLIIGSKPGIGLKVKGRQAFSALYTKIYKFAQSVEADVYELGLLAILKGAS